MKYKTFMFARNLVGASVAGLAVVGAFFGCRNMAEGGKTVPVTTVSAPPTQFTPAPGISPSAGGQTQTVPTGATAEISARDKEVIGLRKQPLSNGKASSGSTKWVAVGNGFKAEFRADSGASAWDRVKIDLDNDKKWDERWDFKSDGSIKRRISPTDDDSTYSVEYRLKSGDTKWMRAK